MSSTEQPSAAANVSAIAPVSPEEIDGSSRWPVLLLALTSLVWLAVGSALGFLASLKFHAPQLMAHCPWFTYGRIHAAHLDLLGYGFAIPAGLGVTLWLMGRLGRTTVQQPGFAVVGALGWNLGLLLSVVGILSGQSSGFEWLEMPAGAGAILFFSYAMVGVSALLTFHARKVRELYVSQWFLFAALFWFPWAFSSARLLLVRWPVTGVVQSAINLWYVHNFTVIWASLLSLAVIFYFLPKLAERPLASRPLALFTFWGLVFLGGWGGIHSAAPLPRWMSAVSTAMNVLMIIPILAAVINYRQTIAGREDTVRGQAGGRFFLFAAVAYLFWGLLQAGSTIRNVTEIAEFTYLSAAIRQGGLLAVLMMTLMGAFYFILPKVAGTTWPLGRLVSLQFTVAVGGVVLYLGSLAAAGLMQGFPLNDPGVAFFESTKRSLMFFRLSTLGDLLLLASSLMLLANFIALLWQGCRACCLASVTNGQKTKPAGVAA